MVEGNFVIDANAKVNWKETKEISPVGMNMARRFTKEVDFFIGFEK